MNCSTYNKRKKFKTGLQKLFFFSFSFLTFTVAAQTAQTIAYTTKEGLPSNSIYRTLIDKRGFLWIATELGLSRFDGKTFKNYNTRNGLTDNEVTDLLIDNSGTIWAIPFKRTPCFYNEVADRFENEETNEELKKLKYNSSYRPFLSHYGGIFFQNGSKEINVFRNGKTEITSLSVLSTTINPQCFVEYNKNSFLAFVKGGISKIEKNQQSTMSIAGSFFSLSEIKADKFYLLTKNSVLVYRFTANGDIFFEKEKIYPFETRIFCNTGKRFAVTSATGTTYLLNENTLEPEEIASSIDDAPVRNVLEDDYQNIWLSTMDKGLIKVQKKRISPLDVKELKQGFNSIILSKGLIAGNNNGEVYKYDGLYTQKLFLNTTKDMSGWVRKILDTKKGFYVATQTGSYILDKNSFKIKESFLTQGGKNRSTKSAYLLNDSIALFGNHVNAFKYNLYKGKVEDSVLKRVVCFGVDKNNQIFIGSNEGLFLWNKNKLEQILPNSKALSFKVSSIVCTPDNLLWVGLSADTLVVLNNNKLVAQISLGSNIPGNICKSLYSNKNGEVWLGTNVGLNKISYTFNNNNFNYSSNYFGVADGLIGEQVNDIAIKDSTVYIATNEGINTMQSNLQLPTADIKTFITAVKINEKPVDIKSEYDLKYDEKNISIEFSGIDLSGFIPTFEYKINNSSWQRDDKISLRNLQSGFYDITIRAIKRDGNPSINEAHIKFNISTAFWQSAIFWGIITLSFFGLLLYWQQQRNKQKQKRAIEKITTEKRLTELEMQALKAQINPHFVFNCLNSIKGFIYEKDFAQADKYLDKFSDLMRSTIDNSDATFITLKDEITYLHNYLQLEKLRFNDKFNYEFNIEKNLGLEKIYVPSMLLQPYVENAIRHGIRYLQNNNGFININIKKGEDFLICEIDDNGIGRGKAALLKSKAHIEYQSKGMSISKRRAELYNIQQEIVDKKDDKQNPLGTTIIVKIPLTLQP